jgi:hypothetical protein
VDPFRGEEDLEAVRGQVEGVAKLSLTEQPGDVSMSRRTSPGVTDGASVTASG